MEALIKTVVNVLHIQRIGCHPEKYFYSVLNTVANPARGLLNGEKRAKRESMAAHPHPTPPPRCYNSSEKTREKLCDASTCLSATQVSMPLIGNKHNKETGNVRPRPDIATERDRPQRDEPNMLSSDQLNTTVQECTPTAEGHSSCGVHQDRT